jgi:3-hydroxyisobutyrate dehydrogenase-like beta-hydroxyacid dehydrogenase
VHEAEVGFIGLGRMGAGMARNLLAGGVPLVVHDARAGVAHDLTSVGARAGESPAAVAAAADLVFTCLPFAPEVRAALFGTDGVAKAARDGLHVIDTTTLHQRDAVAIGADAADAGFGYSDCPISGMPLRAADGTLTMMFGGTEDDLERARPYLELMGSAIVHCGPLGSGQLMKAINNIIYDINIVALCEVLPLAVKAGLDAEQVAAVVTSGTSRSFASDYFVPRILAGRFDTDFSMGEAHKDIVNIEQVASRLGAELPLVDAMTASYEKAIEAGYGDEPKSAIVKVYEQALGVEVRSDPGDARP